MHIFITLYFTYDILEIDFIILIGKICQDQNTDICWNKLKRSICFLSQWPKKCIVIVMKYIEEK